MQSVLCPKHQPSHVPLCTSIVYCVGDEEAEVLRERESLPKLITEVVVVISLILHLGI